MDGLYILVELTAHQVQQGVPQQSLISSSQCFTQPVCRDNSLLSVLINSSVLFIAFHSSIHQSEEYCRCYCFPKFISWPSLCNLLHDLIHTYCFHYQLYKWWLPNQVSFLSSRNISNFLLQWCWNFSQFSKSQFKTYLMRPKNSISKCVCEHAHTLNRNVYVFIKTCTRCLRAYYHVSSSETVLTPNVK